MFKSRRRNGFPPLTLVALFASLSFNAIGAVPQIGGGTCSTSMVNGPYFYLLAGTVSSNGENLPYAELGEIIADGSGGVSGKSFANSNGRTVTSSLTGTYSVQSNCTGTISLRLNPQTTASLTFQVIDKAQAMIMTVSTGGAIVSGRAYRLTAGSGTPQCANGSLSGAYGYLLTGYASVSGQSYLYSDSGQVASDGNGNLSATTTTNLGGTFSNIKGTGTYSLSNSCQGTAVISSPTTTSNYVIAIAQDGQVVLFLETDAGTTVAGTGQPQFSAPQQAVVNGASFQSQMVAPGSLFSVFGMGLSTQSASAQRLPLPLTLGQTQVLLNGTPAPLIYVAAGQINAQMPVGMPAGQPITMTVTNAGAVSNVVTLNLPKAAPGIFTLNGNQAIVQNPNGSINSSSSPAHVGDVLVAYLTGGGAVDSSSWITGAPSPNAQASVTAPYSLTVGTEPAQVEYLGLTPGFVGLYQANFKLPSLTPGDYPIVVTVAGNASNAATVAVAD